MRKATQLRRRPAPFSRATEKNGWTSRAHVSLKETFQHRRSAQQRNTASPAGECLRVSNVIISQFSMVLFACDSAFVHRFIFLSDGV